jgi:farnesyl-diphosphate farnesyltransferase
MNEHATEADWEYCRMILPKVSRTFALNIAQLEGDMYKAVLLGYLLFRIADTFEDTMYRDEKEKIADLKDFSAIFKENRQLGQRLKLYEPLKFRWKENSYAKDLLENGHIVLRCYFNILDTSRQIIDPLLVETSEGMARFQQLKLQTECPIFQLKDIRQLKEYCYCVAGIVGVMLTRLFCQSKSIEAVRSELEKSQISFGIALQLINIIKDYKRDIARGWCYIPLTITRKYQIELAKIESLSIDQIRRITEDMSPLVITRLDSTLRYIKSLPLGEISIRMFCIIPFVIGYRTLGQIVQMRGDKISRQEVASILDKCAAYAHSNALLEQDYLELRNNFLDNQPFS